MGRSVGLSFRPDYSVGDRRPSWGKSIARIRRLPVRCWLRTGPRHWRRRLTGNSFDDVGLVATLLSASASERQAALGQLYRRHAPAVAAFVVACRGDRPVAEQVVEEVFVDLARAPRSYDPCEETLRSYLIRQAHGICLRRAYGEHGLRSRLSETSGPWAGLQPDERVTLALALFGAMTCAKVGEVLGLPRGTVAATIRRALQRSAATWRAGEPLKPAVDQLG